MKEFTLEERAFLRGQYENVQDKIMLGELLDVYALWPHDWLVYMSPIEQNFFTWTRDNGIVGILPQYPCGPYFMDFASPVKRICIELDGKEWHQDRDKDERRDAYLQSQGYMVIRLTGRESYLLVQDPEITYDDDGNETLYDNQLGIRMKQLLKGTPA